MNIPYYVEMNARKFAHKEAFVTEHARYTYADWNDAACAVAHLFQQEGITKGDRVALFLPNGYDFAVAYVAALKLGAMIVPLHVKLTSREVMYILEDSGACALILTEHAKQAIYLSEYSGKLITTTQMNQAISSGERWTNETTMTEETPCTLLYTSGTTGQPKGVLLTNRNVLAVAHMICIEMKMNDDTRTLIMLPLSHSAVLNLFFVSTVLVGGTLVVREEFHPVVFLETVERERTTHFFGPPVVYLLASKVLEQKTYDLQSMQWWVYGGAPVSKTEIGYIQKQFQTNHLTAVYGLTEGGPSGALLFPEEQAEKVGSIGKRASLFTELKVVDYEGNEVAPNEIGEIVIRGLGVMENYWNRPEETEAVFLDGWLRTGDLAKVDEDGYMWIVDRAKDIIISGGVNVYPFEVEQEMMKHPAIEAVAVIGVAHPEWGETVKAFYVSSEEIDETEMKQFLSETLAKFKIPRLYERIDELPRNATGKILKQALKEGKR